MPHYDGIDFVAVLIGYAHDLHMLEQNQIPLGMQCFPGDPILIEIMGLTSLSAFWLLCGSVFHDEAHNAFMVLAPSICSREDEAPQLGGVVRTPSGRAFQSGNALRKERRCLKTEPHLY